MVRHLVKSLPSSIFLAHLLVSQTIHQTMEREMDRRFGAVSAVMRALYLTVVVKRELSLKAKLSIYQSIYVPTLTYGHELWVVTERMRSRIQAAEMSFLCRVAGLSLRDRVRSSDIRRELGVEPLLLRVERGQLRWFGHLIRMPPGRLPLEVWGASGSPRKSWKSLLGRGTSGIPCLACCPHDPASDNRKKMDGWMDGCLV